MGHRDEPYHVGRLHCEGCGAGFAEVAQEADYVTGRKGLQNNLLSRLVVRWNTRVT